MYSAVTSALARLRSERSIVASLRGVAGAELPSAFTTYNGWNRSIVHG